MLEHGVEDGWPVQETKNRYYKGMEGHIKIMLTS